MSRRKYIFLGVTFILGFVLGYGYIIHIIAQSNDVQLLLDNKNIMMFLFGGVCVCMSLLGLGEAMFIRAQIVPKWLRLFFYFQWVVAGVAISTTAIYLLLGGAIG